MIESVDPELDTLKVAPAVEPAFAQAYERFRPRLVRAVALRMDERVRARIDASDVVQDAFVECAGRVETYLRDPPAPLYLWVRYIVLQRLLKLHRDHLGREIRDAGREVRIQQGASPGASSERLAIDLIDSQTTPTQAAVRAEVKRHVQARLDEMDEVDREILVLRHFEHMTSAEAGRVLGIEHDAARKRYHRALKRLKVVLQDIEGLTL